LRSALGIFTGLKQISVGFNTGLFWLRNTISKTRDSINLLDELIFHNNKRSV
jgi:hypothetical protein